MKKILVPTDFSDSANNALDFACDIARKSQAEIELLHVVDFVAPAFGSTGGMVYYEGYDSLSKEMEESAKESISVLIKDPKRKDVKISTNVKVGDPYDSIAKIVSKQDSDLIVLGTQGTSGIHEILIGSNAEKVVRFAHCPVITVPTSYKLGEIKSIAFALDKDMKNKGVFAKVKIIARLFDAELKFVWVHTIHDLENETMTADEIESFITKSGFVDFDFQVLKSISSYEGILRFAQENDIDMIAMATHGRRGLAHLFVGSTAEGVVNHAKRPVWTMSMREQ